MWLVVSCLGAVLHTEVNMNNMMQWFECSHLPEVIRPVSAQCCDLAKAMNGLLPECAEKTAGLRKLLEAKDCFVRAAVGQIKQYDTPIQRDRL